MEELPNKISFEYNNQGECPECGSYNIEYDPMEFGTQNDVYYPARCLDCGCEFNEWYDLVYADKIIVK